MASLTTDDLLVTDDRSVTWPQLIDHLEELRDLCVAWYLMFSYFYNVSVMHTRIL